MVGIIYDDAFKEDCYEMINVVETIVLVALALLVVVISHYDNKKI